MPPAAPIPKDHFRVHYHRPDIAYGGWKLYAFGDTTENTGDYFGGPVSPSGTDEFGIFFDVGLQMAAKRVSVVIHNPTNPGGDLKDPGNDLACNVGRSNEFWVESADPVPHSVNPHAGAFAGMQGYWIDRDTVCIPNEHKNSGWTYSLVYSATAGLPESLSTTPSLSLTPHGSLSPQQLQRFPHLDGYAVFKLAPTPVVTLSQVLKCQVALVAVVAAAGHLAYISGVQTAGVLDDVFFYDGPLGATYAPAGINLRLWAPTAQSIDLQLFDSASAESPVQTVPMTETNGVWSASFSAAHKSHWYLYNVKVYVPDTARIMQSLVTDPYSVDLAVNGTKSRLTDLDDPRTKPAGWDQHSSPHLDAINDLSIYELHVRDFSVADQTVPPEHRGLYLAFTHQDSAGMRHLSALAAAGMKAVHLLPTFHFSSVDEDKLAWQFSGDLSSFPPESQHQQAAIEAIKDTDAYNWGYDPVHYMAPSGAYDFDSESRVIEYRQMIQSLHASGLRVIQDCVFNHTAIHIPPRSSVLDKIVPGYYHRLDPNGKIYNLTCCSDTASEHRMMERLMIDTVVMNAKQFKIDGFRFDLMNFHFVYNMQHIHQALAAVRTDVYLYGEGWNFGETANDQLGPAANQKNLHGSGIGTFNDRLRDAIRGGDPFSDQRTPGFATGLENDAELLQRTDWIRIALTGNLRDYKFIDHTGKLVSGGRVPYLGSGAGYTASPIEVINYCSVHDNQTLFDAIQLKAPAGESTANRARRQVLAMSLVALGQGIPLFQAADDLLRSKSMDQNSFNSGDWFNKIDWSYQTNNWGVGLAIASENKKQWPIHEPLLADDALKPSQADIAHVRLAFQDLLKIRMSSGLFRMHTLHEIQANLHFLNTGPNQHRRLIIMLLKSHGYGPYGTVVVAFNANTDPISFTEAALDGPLVLHPALAASADPIVRECTISAGTLKVPALTTAVFVAP